MSIDITQNHEGYHTIAVETQGDTGSASRIVVNQLATNGDQLRESKLLRVRVCNKGTYALSTNATIAAAGGSALMEAIDAGKDIVINSVQSAAATGTLTISDVVVDGETVVIDGRTYYFSTGATTVPEGNVAIDISDDGTKSQGTLTMDTQPTAGDTVAVGGVNYTWRADGEADVATEINLGANLAEAQTNFVAAVNGTDDLNTANPLAVAADFASDDCVITARYTGTDGDTITTTETFTAGSNVFDAATLGTTTAGVDVSATEGGDALVTALAADSSGVVTGSNSTGTVTLTAKLVGRNGNNYTTTETMANGAFGAATLSGGATGRPDQFKFDLTDATAEEVTVVIGPPPVGPALLASYTATIDVEHEAA